MSEFEGKFEGIGVSYWNSREDTPRGDTQQIEDTCKITCWTFEKTEAIHEGLRLRLRLRIRIRLRLRPRLRLRLRKTKTKTKNKTKNKTNKRPGMTRQKTRQSQDRTRLEKTRIYTRVTPRSKSEDMSKGVVIMVEYAMMAVVVQGPRQYRKEARRISFTTSRGVTVFYREC